MIAATDVVKETSDPVPFDEIDGTVQETLKAAKKTIADARHEMKQIAPPPKSKAKAKAKAKSKAGGA